MRPLIAVFAAALLAGTPAVAQTLKLMGVLRAARSLTVRAACGGQIVAVDVAFGDEVDAGQTLIRLDDRELRIGVERAEARCEAAQVALAIADVEREVVEGRIRGTERRISMAEEHLAACRAALDGWRQALAQKVELVKAGRSSEDELAAARRAVTDAEQLVAGAEVTAADRRADRDTAALVFRQSELAVQRARIELRGCEAELALARSLLERTVIHAPFRCRIEHVAATPGQQVRSGETALVELVDVDEVVVEFRIPAAQVAACAPGTPVVVAHRDFEAEGEISGLGATADDASGMVRAQVRLPNAERRWLPGTSVEVRVRLD
jgi:membrane fusion protein (multidrug efflux system)